MSSANPFTQTGNTVTFTASTTAPAGVQAVSNTLGITQYLIQNAGYATVFLGYGSTNAAAYANAVTVTTTGPAIPLLPQTVQVLTLQPGMFFTGVAAANGSVYVTPGEGT